MEYTVPVYELEKLEKKLNRIRNKGVKVEFKVGEPYKKPIIFEHPDPITHTAYRDIEPTYIKVVDVEVNGHYGIEGWEFVGTIEHASNGNIVRVINDSFKVPNEFYTKGPECDHCHRIRDRKDTYLIRNTETGEYKQVGKSCLREYTGGLDADACAEWHTVDAWLSKMFDKEALSQYGGEDRHTGDTAYNGTTIKKIAYGIIKERGYQKASNGNGTVYQVESAYYDAKKRPAVLGTDEQLAAIDEWADEKEKEIGGRYDYGFNGYLHNAIIAWKEKFPEFRDLPLVVSLINTYFKDVQAKAQAQTNAETSESQYLGEVGDNIEFKVIAYKLLYTKEGYYGGNPTYVYQLIDDKGNNIILETTNIDAADMANYDESNVFASEANPNPKGLKMKAKVKAHKEYKGIKQTVVNRAKVLDENMSTADALEYLKN